MASPVAGLRPIRALLLRLRKIPNPARRSEPSFFSSRTTRAVNSSSAVLACFLVIPTLSARCADTCDCVIILLLTPHNAAASQRERALSLMQVPKSRKSLFFLRIEQIFQQVLHLATVRQQDC